MGKLPDAARPSTFIAEMQAAFDPGWAWMRMEVGTTVGEKTIVLTSFVPMPFIATSTPPMVNVI